jgi:hypothetical protein
LVTLRAVKTDGYAVSNRILTTSPKTACGAIPFVLVRQKSRTDTAEPVMATLTSSNAPGTASSHETTGLLSEIRMFWRQFFVAAFDPYRPEQHYMRGPGPACAAKDSASSR